MKTREEEKRNRRRGEKRGLLSEGENLLRELICNSWKPCRSRIECFVENEDRRCFRYEENGLNRNFRQVTLFLMHQIKQRSSEKPCSSVILVETRKIDSKHTRKG
mmetsp:Transcript_63939/g.73350  ORF Transcript_63939/g.73350 Transcript_63939/m.73350 type:complete len:105 (-) Transcript_63939:752-1066(-)